MEGHGTGRYEMHRELRGKVTETRTEQQGFLSPLSPEIAYPVSASTALSKGSRTDKAPDQLTHTKTWEFVLG